MKKQIYISAVWICLFFTLVDGTQGEDTKSDILSVRGIQVTKGAAPGYVKDRICAMCHNSRYRSYQEVGMARSFYRPRADRFIENFEDNHFYHELSKRHYEISRQGDRLFFKRYQLDETGKPINMFSREIDWIMGSGNHSRVYFFQTEAGELYQLPVAWYTQTNSWGMSPGYDRVDHLGVSRRVRRECMFCHNAYPDVEENSDAFDAPHVYPKEMPEGTGCQRCHGPGANHVRIILDGELEPEKIRAAIVNPKRLTPQLRNDICFQCHFQPSVALFGVRRFDRNDYSFRPGQRLADYLVQMDIKEEGKEQKDRFEINHHPYRLIQSRCYKESKDTMSCLTCHNPHRKVPEKERIIHYRDACLKCHQAEHCTRKSDTAGSTEPEDCVSCHMPRRRTQDVVNVVMTDHLIQRQPISKVERLAPLKETLPIIVDALFPDQQQAPAGALGEVYRVVAIFRAGGGAHVVDRLETMLAKAKPSEPVPYFDLARGQLNYRRFADAEKTLNAILSKDPDQKLAHEWLGIALIGLNQKKKALETFRNLLKYEKYRPEAEYNLGRLLLAQGEYQEAEKHLEQALKKRPTLVPAWFQLGNAQARLNRTENAIQSYQQALNISPTFTRVYLALGHILLKKGDQSEALRYWRHGLKTVSDPKPIANALEQYLASQEK